MLQNPGGMNQDQVVGDDVHYIVVEQGRWELPNGALIEARRIESDQVMSNRDCTGQGEDCGWDTDLMEAFSYANPHNNAVVLGQVMSYHDERWSAFGCRREEDTGPPSSSSCFVGRSVEESPDPGDTPATRLNEVLGVIVMEEGSGTLLSNKYQVFLGDRGATPTIQGILDGGAYSYPLTEWSTTPRIAIVTQAGMNGKEGSWAYLRGPFPFSHSAVQLAIDEDQVHDSERNNPGEHVSVAVFGSPGSYELTVPKLPSPTPWQSIQSPTPIIENLLFVGDEDSDGGGDVDGK
jgi:hypothetical protein